MKYLIYFILLTLCHVSYAQWAIPQQMRASNTLDRLSDKDGLGKSDMLYGIPHPPGGVVGNSYLVDEWNVSTLLLFETEKMLEGYPVKYDIKTNVIEIKSGKDVKVMDGNKVKSMVWYARDSLNYYFVNASAYTLDGAPLSGFLEIIIDGPTPLFKRTTVHEKEPTYIQAFDVGSRDRKIYKKDAFYYSSGGKLTKITNKKTLLPAFGEYAADVEEFIKTNKLDIGKQRGLAKAFEYYNTKNGTLPRP